MSFLKSPAGRAPAGLLFILLCLPRPGAAMWANSNCFYDGFGESQCNGGLSYGARAGIGASILFTFLSIFMLWWCCYRETRVGDLEEVYITQVVRAGVYPYVPGYYSQRVVLPQPPQPAGHDVHANAAPVNTQQPQPPLPTRKDSLAEPELQNGPVADNWRDVPKTPATPATPRIVLSDPKGKQREISPGTPGLGVR